MSNIGDRLKEARERLNLKQTQVMAKTGINNKTLSGYENGVSEPDIDTLNILAALYGVTVDWLTGRTNDRTRVLQPQSRKMIDLIDQNVSDEDIYKAFAETFLIDGIPMPKEEALILIDIIRARRARLKKVPDHSDSTDSVSTP